MQKPKKQEEAKSCIYRAGGKRSGYLVIVFFLAMILFFCSFFYDYFSVTGFIVGCVVDFLIFILLAHKKLGIVEFYNSYILVSFPFRIIGPRHKKIDFKDIHRIYYYDGPFPLNHPSVTIMYKDVSVSKKVGFGCKGVWEIIEVFRTLKMLGVNVEIDQKYDTGYERFNN